MKNLYVFCSNIHPQILTFFKLIEFHSSLLWKVSRYHPLPVKNKIGEGSFFFCRIMTIYKPGFSRFWKNSTSLKSNNLDKKIKRLEDPPCAWTKTLIHNLYISFLLLLFFKYLYNIFPVLDERKKKENRTIKLNFDIV